MQGGVEGGRLKISHGQDSLLTAPQQRSRKICPTDDPDRSEQFFEPKKLQFDDMPTLSRVQLNPVPQTVDFGDTECCFHSPEES